MNNYQKSEFMVKYVMAILVSLCGAAFAFLIGFVFNITMIEASNPNTVGWLLVGLFYLVTVALVAVSVYLSIPFFKRNKKATA